MELLKMTISDIIKLVEEIKKPEQDKLKITHGVFSDGYVTACDDIIAQLSTIKPLNKCAS